MIAYIYIYIYRERERGRKRYQRIMMKYAVLYEQK